MKFYMYTEEKMRRFGGKLFQAKKYIKAIGILFVAFFIAQFSKGDIDEKIYADTAEEIRDEAEEDIEKLKDQIENIEEFQASIAKDLESAAKEMDGLMAVQSELNDTITQKQEEIEEANTALLEALTRESETYESMKLRIQYMYENNMANSITTILLEANSIADVLSQVEYVNSIYEADRRLMEEYKQAAVDVETKQTQLATDMEELLALQEEYELRQANLEVYIEGLGADADAYASQLSDAKEQIDKYEAIVAEQERIIAEQKAAEEAARLRAEREAAEREQKKNEQKEDEQKGDEQNNPDLGSSEYLSDSSYNPEFTSDVTGEELVNYALQFVGNPYVWGGNSLTEGCDCSGFVKLVYGHFGFDTPRYSQSFKTYGKPVAFENIQAGDIVVYPGHVAIYIGNGYIVEAQSTKRGITCNRLVTCSTITAIRRIL